MDYTAAVLFITQCIILAVSPVQSTLTYTIIPNDTSTHHNESYGPGSKTTFTLQQLTDSFFNHSSLSFQNNITLVLSFAPGRHYLIGGVELNDMASVAIRGQVTNGNKPEISCKEKSCFSFTNTSSVLIENLMFTECFSESSDGGAIFISEAETVSITQCLFVDNLVRNHGSAMRLQVIEYLSILQSQFINNSAIDSRLMQNCNASSGALSAANISLFVITESLFEDNTASCHSGAVFVSHSSTRVVNSTFNGNGVLYRALGRHPCGGALLTDKGSVQILDSIFEKNYVGYDTSPSFTCYISGGAACIIDTTIFINNTDFNSNMAFFVLSRAGGALAIHLTSNYHTVLLNSAFQNNWSNGHGAVSLKLAETTSYDYDEEITLIGDESVVSITSCNFISNFIEAGVININKGVLTITGCVFERNYGIQGGAIQSANTFIYSRDNHFISNVAAHKGGALSVHSGRLFSKSDQYLGNEAIGSGGAIAADYSHVSTLNCTFSNNKANFGAGVVLYNGTFHSVKSFFESNSAHQAGSAQDLAHSMINVFGDYFHNHKLLGEFFDYESLVNILSKSVIAKDDQVSTIQLINVNGNCNNLIFSNNIGSTYLLHSTILFSGSTIFANNTGVAGGALTLIQSTASFEKSSEIYVTGNNASHGGGVFLSGSSLAVHASLLKIESNRATEFGGGIYAYQSSYVIDTPDLVLHTGNSATQGGAIFLTASSIEIFKGFTVFTNNKALRGGAVALSKSAKIYILKTVEEPIYNSNADVFVKVAFSSNTAEYGGALYVDDNSNSDALCDQSTQNFIPSITTKECFIQTVRLYETSFLLSNLEYYNFVNVFFSSNIANKLGNDIFGGLLDRCKISAIGELQNLITKQTTGLTYLKVIARFQVEIKDNLITHPLNYSHVVTKEHLKDLIASNPVQLCFCTNKTYFDCLYQWPEISVERACGHPFSIRVVAVDQVENPVNATVLAKIIASESGARLKTGQSQQLLAGTCTDLIYNVFSAELNVTLELYPDGPCASTGISSRKITINFTECDCPSGLQPAPLNDECKCECKDSLNTYVNSCQLNNDVDINHNVTVTVVRATKDYWIQYYDNTHNNSGFLLEPCPYDYCVDNVNLSISLPLNVDKQCAYNRSGIMCGECEEGLSLVFSSSRCLDCSNNYLALLIAFALAGIVLVAFIFILNMTVAIGTIHGLILYSSIVTTNGSIFVPPKTALRFFISWVNLDLGIETCFYDGMDAHAKVLLQVVFPVYIVSLSMLIIIASNNWGWFAGVIGHKNPVATLCTLFLLSCPKLLRTTIVSLQFTLLTYPDNSSSILWLYNPMISYFAPKRTPLFIFSFTIIILALIFTILLFFGQWLKKIPKFARFTQNIKYNAFLDAYHAPFVFKHQYWIGALLFFRIIHHSLSTVLEESTFLLTASCLMCVLLILKQFIVKVYKNWLIGFLETSYLMNALLFFVTTSYVNNTNGDQVALANISISIALLTFLGIVLYHIHAYFLSGLKAYDKLFTAVKECLDILKQKTRSTPKPTSHNRDIDDTELQMDQLREPALDIIAPITTQDYRSRRCSSTVVPNTSTVTSTVVCINSE